MKVQYIHDVRSYVKFLKRHNYSGELKSNAQLNMIYHDLLEHKPIKTLTNTENVDRRLLCKVLFVLSEQYDFTITLKRSVYDFFNKCRVNSDNGIGYLSSGIFTEYIHHFLDKFPFLRLYFYYPLSGESFEEL